MEVEEKTMGNEMKKFSQKPLSQKRDSIGALLEQKLKELTSQEDEELATGGPPKRSTAMILQELISALTSDHPEIVSPSIVSGLLLLFFIFVLSTVPFLIFDL